MGKVYFYSLILAIILVFVSPWLVSVEVQGYDQAIILKSGFPFPFLVQETTLTPPVGSLPLKLRAGSIGENPTLIEPEGFLLSVAVIYPFCVVAIGLLSTTYQRLSDKT